MTNEELILRIEIEALTNRWAWLLDHGPYAEIPELFTDDGVYIFEGQWDVRGIAALRDRYAKRVDGDRVARHVSSNLRLEIIGPDHATGTGLLTIFKRQGQGMSPAVPTAVADFVDQYVRGSDGVWRFRERR